MYSFPSLAIKYLEFYFSASNGKGHGTHSPFVFDFITRVLNDKTNFPGYGYMDAVRKSLLSDGSILEITDLGAGSFKGNQARKTVSELARTSSKPKKYARLLYRIANYYQPRRIIELGTSLGLSTVSLAYGAPQSMVWTIEGAREIAERAGRLFAELGLGNIRSITGNFDDCLPGILREAGKVDLCFIDGNHRKEPTLRYFEWLLEAINYQSILVFDDIHWSAEMEEAWEQIGDHAAVTATIDLFFMGIVLFRREFREKQHFRIRF